MSNTDKVAAAEFLKGHRVLEWVPSDEPGLVHIAVAFAGRLLSDLGAEVTRVIPVNDPLTTTRTYASEASEALAEDVEAGSLLSAYLDRKKHRAKAGEVDAKIESSHLALLGTEDQLKALDTQTQLTAVVASAFPSGKGFDDVPVSELGIQGVVGLTDLFGEPDGQPLMMGGHQTAYAMGYAVFLAAMASVAKLTFQGKGDTARVNAVDALAWINWKGVAAGALGFPIRRGGRAAEAPVLKCADGYFALLHLPNNWKDLCSEVDDPRLLDEQFERPGKRAKNALALNEILAEWAAPLKRAELFEFCQRCAIPGGPIFHGADLLQDPLYLHRNYLETLSYDNEDELKVPGLPLTVETVSPVRDSAPRLGQKNTLVPLAEDSDLPLAGMLVIDLGIFTAGSVASTLLADLGARVIKIESESYSDPFRIWPGIKGDSPLFTFNNRNKLGVNIDLKTDAGKATFLELVASADIVVENFRRGVLERLGIDFPVLKSANPNIILASVSGQGASGPGSGHVSFGSTLEAIGGVAALTGYKDGPCYISGRNLNYPDQIVCLYGAGAVIASLIKAKDAGVGMHIDISQREVTTLAVGEQVAYASLKGGEAREDFPGNTDINMALQDIYRVSDGWLCVSVFGQKEMDALAGFLEATKPDVETKLVRWLSEQDAKTAASSLRTLGVVAFKANTGAEAGEEEAIKSGYAFTQTASGAMVKGFPFQFDASPMTIYEESPAMGEHTEQVLGLLN